MCMRCTVGCGGQSDCDKFACNRSLSTRRCAKFADPTWMPCASTGWQAQAYCITHHGAACIQELQSIAAASNAKVRAKRVFSNANGPVSEAHRGRFPLLTQGPGTHCCVPGDLCGFFLGLGLLGTTALAADTRHMVTITTHGLATLSACFARFVASKFVRIATGMRRLATTARQQSALLRIQCGKTAPAASCVLSVLHCASSRCVDDYVTGYRRYRNYRANPQTHAFRCGDDQCRQKRLRSLCKSCTPAFTRPDPKGIALPRTRRSAPLRAG
ncbi:hypothetical protein XCC2019 [Xanthomonas campestris pv. campestris str. ATCC 33913]|uniref:Uncharacterized protein n=1 Tax=Xanthomonas campestris pv. campestris (strain ATCC 33913 / DSM 3586 / NCPPB 528 / LMG 568 / P 25) TaxID=190485 RepID=Q8P947_XANCP|nr:hypothetical protein XCC2019 [Xanthomonas campestris pv. campestris str. ATCC 33913]